MNQPTNERTNERTRLWAGPRNEVVDGRIVVAVDVSARDEAALAVTDEVEAVCQQRVAPHFLRKRINLDEHQHATINCFALNFEVATGRTTTSSYCATISIRASLATPAC